MQELSRMFAVLAILGFAAQPALAGGSARVRVDGAPGRIVAGKPFELAITVIPRNWSHRRDVAPVVVAECEGRKVSVAAVAERRANRYKATVSLPSAGEWKIRVDSRFCHTEMEPIAIRALAGRPQASGKAGG